LLLSSPELAANGASPRLSPPLGVPRFLLPCSFLSSRILFLPIRFVEPTTNREEERRHKLLPVLSLAVAVAVASVGLDVYVPWQQGEERGTEDDNHTATADLFVAPSLSFFLGGKL